MTLDRLKAALADRYRITRELGAGGMATVFLAHDLKHDRQVAIKVLRPELAAVIGAERFLAEIKTTANLQHPHILPLFDSGAADGFLYYVMPYVEGESLRDRLTREHQLAINDAIRITVEVAGALDYAHRRGVIHRDIKPENILLHDGRALIADFGIALAASKAGGSRMTETGMSLGTPHYMSPEQAMGERTLDARTDVYALGVVAYELLVGDPPFIGSTAQAIVAKVLTERPTPLSTVRDTIPPGVESAILTALAKLPADRFASAADFAAALTSGTTTGGTRNTPERGGTVSLAVRRRDRRTTTLLATLTVAALLLALWGWVGPGRRSAPAVWDVGLPDSGHMAFRPFSGSASYGISFRALTISPDGSTVVYTAPLGDSTLLWVRTLRDTVARPLVGTAGAGAPRLSPDGTRIAYVMGEKTWVIPLAGGEPRAVFEAIGGAHSPRWISNDELIAADHDGYQMHWIQVDGRGVQGKEIPRCVFGEWSAELGRLVCSNAGVAVAFDPALDVPEVTRLTARTEDGSPPTPVAGSAFRVIEGKYLVYLALDGDLVGARYDAGTNTIGTGVTLLAGIRREATGEAQFDIAPNGDLVYAPGPDGIVGQFVTLHRGGEPAPLRAERGTFQRFDLSPDRRRLAAVLITASGNELRIYDLRDGQQYTVSSEESIGHALWGPDGRVLLTSFRMGTNATWLRGDPAAASGTEMIFKAPWGIRSPDVMDYHDAHLALGMDRLRGMVLRFDPSLPKAVFDTIAEGLRFPSVSPNGRLMAYQTAEGTHVMVTSFPTAGRRHLLASKGTEPLWLSASEVLFRAGYAWFSVRVDPSTGEPIGAPVEWGRDPRFNDTPGWSNRLSHDGGILYVQGPPQSGASYFRVIPGWVDQMKRMVDAAPR